LPTVSIVVRSLEYNEACKISYVPYVIIWHLYHIWTFERGRGKKKEEKREKKKRKGENV